MSADKTALSKASWSLTDQGVVSLGSFLTNIVLARHFTLAEYGSFTLLVGALMGLLLVNNSLLAYPASLRLTVAEGDARQSLLRTVMLLTGVACLPMGLILGGAILAFGRPDILGAALCYFLMQQYQTVTRRSLIATFRLRAAVLGDGIAYLGPLPLFGLLFLDNNLTLPHALYSLAALSAIAAAVQTIQLNLWIGPCLSLRSAIEEFWQPGRWALANGLLAYLRIQVIPWALAASLGPGGAAAFQAVANIANLINPIVMGLCNVIPVTATRALIGGPRRAWMAIRPYALFGAVPVLCYCVAGLAVPDLILFGFYGSESPYLDLSIAVRLVVVSSVIAYVVEMIVAYFYGVEFVRSALLINTVGFAVSIALVIPFSTLWGLNGTCVALICVDASRLAAASIALSSLLGGKPRYV